MSGIKTKLNKGILFLLLFIPLLLVIPSDAGSQDKSIDKSPQNEINQKIPASGKGLKVYIDPDTGELISQPEEAEIVQPSNSVFGDTPEEVVEQPEEIINPDGSATVIMPDSMQHSTSITIDKNGKQTTECKREHEHNHE